MTKIIVTGSFDDLRSRQVRFLEEAAKLGQVEVLLFSDEAARTLDGREPKFSQAERQYFVQALRYVSRVTLVEGTAPQALLAQGRAIKPDLWVVDESNSFLFKELGDNLLKIVPEEALKGFPTTATDGAAASALRRKKVIVSGCYDWLHSGHVRFFEEVSALGNLYVVVGSDANVRFLKGAGHPLFAQDERRYMVQAVRYVHQALISTGWDWLDYAPQVEEVQPDIFAVNEDGDKPEKRQFCLEHGIDYVVLKRTPKEGLPRRESTRLRGF
jgi:cytidyltransferase-like protein